MTLPTLVTGGTGRLGRHVVSQLRDRGCEVRVLTRQTREGAEGVEYVSGDLAADSRIDLAVKGVGTIVHCASAKKGDADATRNLVRAASAAGVKHLVYISLVGADTASWGYAKVKLESEHLVAGSGIPWTLQRATQFYELILGGARQLGKLPVVPVPAGFLIQPVDSRDVAERLAELALDEPAGRVTDLAGPAVLTFADVMRQYLTATGHPRRRVLSIRLPGTAQVRAGSMLPAKDPEPVLGHRTWEEFLREQSPRT